MSEHDELVEKVARAIYEAHPGAATWRELKARGSDRYRLCMDEARAALSAMPTAGDGWQDIASAPKTDPANMRALPFLGWCPDRTAPLGGDIRVIWWEPHISRDGETKACWWGDRDMQEFPKFWRPLPPPPGAKP